MTGAPLGHSVSYATLSPSVELGADRMPGSLLASLLVAWSLGGVATGLSSFRYANDPEHQWEWGFHKHAAEGVLSLWCAAERSSESPLVS